MIQLSKLDAGVLIAQAGGPIMTVAEFKNEITIHGAEAFPGGEWHTIEAKRWEPNAETMIKNYVEHEGQDMYEEWEQHAGECINPEVIEELQTVLDKAFGGNFGAYATLYYTLEELISIDITEGVAE